MAIIYGAKEGGGSGVLNVTELASLLRKKSGNRASESSCNACATHILDRNSHDGGGGTQCKDAGNTVFHFSRGRRGGNDGCTVFYTLTQGRHGSVVNGRKQVDDVLVARICAVGWHAGDSDHTYDLDWGSGRKFYAGSRFDISVSK